MENHSQSTGVWNIELTIHCSENRTSPPAPVDPVSDAYILAFTKICIGIWLSISILGISTNVVNIVTFIEIGIKDSVTISFFFLALSDFFICLLNFASTITSLIEVVAQELGVSLYLQPFVPTVYLVITIKIFSYIAVSISVYLAAQRSLCVVFPLHVKQLFSNFRTYCYIGVISTFITICTGIVMARHHVRQLTNSATNLTYVEVYIIAGSEYYIYLFSVVGNFVFSTGSPLLVLLCLFVLAIGLRKSTQFRKSVSGINGKGMETPGCRSTSAEKEERKVSKEMQALVQVTLLSVIFVVTNLPNLGVGLVSVLISGFYLHGAYNNMYHIAMSLGFTGELVNSSVNSFVYYKYNSKYRKACSSWLRRKMEQR